MIEQLGSIFSNFILKANEYLANYILVIMLVGIGLWYTIKTNFVQVRCLGEGVKKIFSEASLSGKTKNGEITSFQALSTAIASQVGTGNVVGAAGAILIGGPGAVFWMWIIAFLGMATIYAEATLAIATRIEHKDGSISGGPVYYITTAFKGKLGNFLAKFFAIACVLALGFMGAMVQSNSIAYSLKTAFNFPTWVSGIFLVILCATIYLGGIKRLASVTEKMVPLMAIFFIIGGFIILIARIKYIPETFYMIFHYAFHPDAIIGGGLGYALRTAIIQGTKRSLFSNEAGMGSTPHAHALANVKNPHEQGIVAMIGVFIDIFVVLTMNALIIISTFYTSDGLLHQGYVGAITETLNNTNLVQMAFAQVMGKTNGTIYVAVCLFFFAFSSILGWNFFGKINAVYLFGKNNPKRAEFIYYILSLAFVMIGTTMSNNFVWELADFANNLMVIPNVIALFALTGTVLCIIKNKDN